MHTEVTKEQVHSFLMGSNPQERIIKIESDYSDDKVYVISRDENGNKVIETDEFRPFVWCKQSTGRQLYNENRSKLKEAMEKFCIGCKGLRVADSDGNVNERMERGYRVMFYARKNMSFSYFQKFFDEGGRPIYPKEKDKNYGLKEYICVSPVEQYMIYTGKRLFKGYNDYDDLLRLSWDLETEGLNPEKHMISQIGIRTNKGFEKVIPITGNTREEKFQNEMKGLREFFQTVKDIDPDVMTGHNTENFDWNFIDVRLSEHGSTMCDFTKSIFNKRGIYKKKTKPNVLKLGGEMEYYYPTVKWGTNLTDSLFAVRRAQVLDSNMKKADLKYVTKYSKLNKKNRVYVPGKIINSTWVNTNKEYAFNNDDGEWFKISERIDKTLENGEKRIIIDGETVIDNKKKKKYKIVTGRYIVERYLLDDLYETDKIEVRYNQSNFLVGKMLPVSYEKMCTMGTAAIWKYIMLAWSYEYGLAIPELIERKPFTGGLSRLLKVGYVDRIVKLDFNSLYPSIILTFNIRTPVDIMGVMNAILEYILTQREYFKELKAEEGGKAKQLKKMLDAITSQIEINKITNEIQKHEAEAARNDKMQLPLKTTGNAFFGSYGSGSVFPHSDLTCAEETTCTGRMMLRLMISHFAKLGYEPIVGDSFTNDTPLFIKYHKNNLIDIKQIDELINIDKIKIDKFGREYDTSEKDYDVLCRSGWVSPSYIYRHKTNKEIYRVKDEHSMVDITQDHSLYNNRQQKVSPLEIDKDTKLEYFKGEINGEHINVREEDIDKLFKKCIKDNRVPIEILNADKKIKNMFFNKIKNHIKNHENYSMTKVMIAGLRYIIKQ